jgi:hypothetical protein
MKKKDHTNEIAEKVVVTETFDTAHKAATMAGIGLDYHDRHLRSISVAAIPSVIACACNATWAHLPTL